MSHNEKTWSRRQAEQQRNTNPAALLLRPRPLPGGGSFVAFSRLFLLLCVPFTATPAPTFVGHHPFPYLLKTSALSVKMRPLCFTLEAERLVEIIEALSFSHFPFLASPPVPFCRLVCVLEVTASALGLGSSCPPLPSPP